jgi:hypothetical protein
MNAPCIVNRKGRTPRSLEHVYDRMAIKVDTLAVDEVFRVRQAESPSKKWFHERALLNRITLATKSIDGDLVVIRIK